jgi:glycosyltransferase involved in cell wall biosynthesis
MPSGRILLISHGAGVGGATRSIGLLARHLPGSMILVPNEGPILELYKRIGVSFTIQRVPNLFYSTYQGISLFGVLRLIKDMPKIRALNWWIQHGYRILHFNEIVFAPTIWMLRHIYGSSIKIITHARVTMPAGTFGFVRSGYQRMLRSCDAVVAIGPHEMEPFRDFPKTLQLMNPVDFCGYEPAGRKTPFLHRRFNIPDSIPIGGSFAQIHKGKGQDFLVRCMAAAPELPDFRLIFFGEGPMESELRAFVKSQGLSNRVIFAGYTNDLFEAMEGCDFIVRAEDFGYMGRDILEANALGVPILCSNKPGTENANLFKEGYNGFSFPPLDRDGFFSALTRILSSTEGLRGITRSDHWGFLSGEEYARRISAFCYQ